MNFLYSLLLLAKKTPELAWADTRVDQPDTVFLPADCREELLPTRPAALLPSPVTGARRAS